RPAMGALANAVKEEITSALEARGAALGAEALARAAGERLDVTAPGRRRPLGHVHPLRAAEDEIVEIFLALGFDVADGPEVEDEEHNFEALNIPADHPARDMQDTFYLEPGFDVLLRTHTSPVQIRVMRAQPPPLRVVIPGTVYRRDDPDATHSPVFQQIEGLMVGERVSFADLKGVLTLFLQRLFGPATRLRFRPSFFPFTEPSAEVDMTCMRCAGAGTSGCRVCKGSGWLEILGCGMVHPNVFRAVGYDPERVQGFAFGMGIDRIVMLQRGIEDLRLLYENDVRFLEQC
ncbi:MAG TPA: phenylalanine--tRNA ligase subunit alpha, partial [Candidatus Limnocylindria bacterium]|nr:phenylalanine--tRNA ligase subunit alpha [Candidatus Limnocylindria bacterium]